MPVNAEASPSGRTKVSDRYLYLYIIISIIDIIIIIISMLWIYFDVSGVEMAGQILMIDYVVTGMVVGVAKTN